MTPTNVRIRGAHAVSLTCDGVANRRVEDAARSRVTSTACVRTGA